MISVSLTNSVIFYINFVFYTNFVSYKNIEGLKISYIPGGFMFTSVQASVKKITFSSKNKKQEIVIILDDQKIESPIKNALKDVKEYNFTYINNHKNLISALEKIKPAFVFNTCEQAYNNDTRMKLHISALLEMLGIPYSGPSPDGFAIGYNKFIVASIASSLCINIPAETYFDLNDPSVKIPTEFPVVIKSNLGGCLKNKVVSNAKEFQEYIEQAKQSMSDGLLVVQEFLSGDEYSVSIVGNRGNYTILPIIKMNSEKRLSEITKNDAQKIIDASIKMFERTGCRDYAQFDFRVDDNGQIKLIKVIPSPDLSLNSTFTRVAKMNGMTYAAMLELILKASRQRYIFSEVSDEKPLEL
ncbi:MAG: ATP-grasp domain-containing protein [Candidatus Babeliales bacterium]|jgi:D-alanine-D-alanine ligase